MEAALILVVLAAVIAILCGYNASDRESAQADVRVLSEGWYRMEGEERIPVELPGTIVLDSDADLTICNDSLTEADAGMMVSVRGAVCRPKISVGDVQIYSYNDEGFPRNENMRAKLYCNAKLPANEAPGTLRITLENFGNGRFELSKVYIGSEKGMFLSHCASESFTIFLVFSMVLMAVLALIIYINLHIFHMPDERSANVAVFLLLCAAWCALDSSLVQEISAQSPLICYLSFYAFMTFSIPVVHFVRNTGRMRRFKSLAICQGLFYANAILQSALYLFFDVDFIKMLWVTHVLLLGGVCLCGFLLMRESRVVKSRELRYTLWAFVMLAASGVLAMLLYWMLGISYYGMIFEAGILVFIVCLLCAVISTTVENLRLKFELRAYQRLSLKDGLTGLDNRRSFDQYFEKLEREAGNFRNVGLFFLDLNDLKYTNDHYGHNAGDECIISIARCIQRIFGGAGTCFRIGGDEFAVVLPNPMENMETWSVRLEEGVRQHNAGARNRLSVAWGYSCMREENGQIKRMSDWKYEADQAMYVDKKRKKVLLEGNGNDL